MATLGRKTALEISNAWDDLQKDDAIVALKKLPFFGAYEEIMKSQFASQLAKPEPMRKKPRIRETK